MLIGLSGSLLSHHFAERIVYERFAGRLGETSVAPAHRKFVRWWHAAASQLGPASSIRAVWEIAAAPLAEQLGFRLERCLSVRNNRYSAVGAGDHVHISVFAATWDVPLDALWREGVRCAISADAPWVFCTNGRQLRLVDSRHTYSRSYLQFELRNAAEHMSTFAILWAALRADAFVAPGVQGPLIDNLIAASAEHGLAVGRSLRFGVIQAVQHLLRGLHSCRRRREPSELFEESLTVVYRMLFLMFAESRALVPNWHPLYRESYTIEALRHQVERPGRTVGVWETLQAIARLVHKGCRAGTLVVPAFNGRLFSPTRAPIAESCAVDEEAAKQALLAVSTRVDRKARTRIDYRDLGVEQLGAVYETLLDYEPLADAAHGAPQLRRGGGARKATGSFYTPQLITDYMVRRTLHPLVAEATSDQILSLRILDPAMGSAAFLVSACRYLARACEQALVNEGSVIGELDAGARADLRRQIAQRCLFGVDLNPTAVQLARLSLWLATLSAHKPLTFLDHHLVCGNSLLGASPFDITRQPPGFTKRPTSTALPLFSDANFESSISHAVVERRWLAATSDDTVDIVRDKERRLERLRARPGWKAVANLWCACWMWPDDDCPAPAVFAALADGLLGRGSSLPDELARSLLQRAGAIDAAHRFFHWMFEFPEVFFDERGQPLAGAGFDAVLGNPPWDMLRSGGAERTFIQSSGIYRCQTAGHLNRYQMFVERAFSLTRRGGRVGLVVPSGFATDHGSARLRRHLLDQANLDTITGFDNRKGIFPIHRSMRFLICTSTAGAPTRQIDCRFGIDDAGELETIPDAGDRSGTPSHPITVTPAFLAAHSEMLTIPELRTETDLSIVERIVHTVPRLGDPAGWNVRFGRELNATDDRRHFRTTGRGLPVLEGKHIEPFRVHLDRSTLRIAERRAHELLEAAATFQRPRVAYRDVASSTNRLSLIAAILPPRVVTTHSLFCLKTALSSANQAFLCGMLNSYVANYLVRQVMTTHLGSATIEGLRVPKPPFDAPVFHEIVDLSHRLRHGPSDGDYARLQAAAARAYGLTSAEFAHVLRTFPLVDEADRRMAMQEFEAGPEASGSAGLTST